MALATVDRRTLRPAPGALRPIALGALGIGLLLLVWEVAGREGWLGSTLVPPSTVLETLTGVRRTVIERAFWASAGAALRGFTVGVLVATLGAMLGLVVPILRPGIDRLAAVVNALPIITLAPLFIVTLGRDGTPTAIAALASSFAMFVAATSAFAAARGAHQDVFTVLGSSRVKRLRSLQFPAAVPGLVDGLRLAAPAAVLGSVLGEWFGAPRGIGLLIVSAMQNYQIGLLWTAALLAAALSMLAFGLLSLLSRAAAKRWGC